MEDVALPTANSLTAPTTTIVGNLQAIGQRQLSPVPALVPMLTGSYRSYAQTLPLSINMAGGVTG